MNMKTSNCLRRFPSRRSSFQGAVFIVCGTEQFLQMFKNLPKSYVEENVIEELFGPTTCQSKHWSKLAKYAEIEPRKIVYMEVSGIIGHDSRKIGQNCQI